ncbi:hCG2009172 [Homo sapiens]|nr:C21orf85 protein [Homo sapiens]EAX09298.1 hCG2009172 [Homo sapiens]
MFFFYFGSFMLGSLIKLGLFFFLTQAKESTQNKEILSGTGINFKKRISTPAKITTYFSIMATNYINRFSLLLFILGESILVNFFRYCALEPNLEVR